jgi:hypothetical protein
LVNYGDNLEIEGEINVPWLTPRDTFAGSPVVNFYDIGFL